MAALSQGPAGRRLLEPCRIGPLEVPNRIVMAAMTTRSADPEGLVTEDTIAWYEARARGGVGLVTVEMAAPERAGRHRHRELGILDDRHLPGLGRLAAAIKAHGARAAIQLGHGGGHTRADIMGEPPIAPSAVPHPVLEVTFATVVPEAMTAERIEATTEAFVAAARRAREAGFDAVEIHAAHGYLLSQFLCPAENRRDDAWGGSLDNRARFPLEVLRRVKRALPDRAVVFRLSADDLFPGGMPLAEGLEVARRAAAAGADAIHVSAGHYRSLPSAMVMTPPMAMPEAPFLDMAARVKALVDVPVIAVGRLGDPAVALAAVEQGRCDLVALGRPLVADPDWPAKVGRGLPVRRCLACNACVNGMRSGGGLRCLVNPLAGRERRFADPRPPRGERIAVIGAGPAGLAYALAVASGNRVTLLERASEVGGAFRLAGLVPLFEEVEARPEPLLAHVLGQLAACRAAGVEVRLGVDPLARPAELAGFDRVVLATGAAWPPGLGPLVRLVLGSRLRGLAPIRALLARPGLRDWLYHRARRATAERLRPALRAGQRLVVIGDARRPGKAGAAIASALAAALLDDPAALDAQTAARGGRP